MRCTTALALTLALLPQWACATYWQANRLEEKVDRLIENTNRTTLSAIFGEQSSAITQKMETLSGEERGKLDNLIESYQRGSTSIEDVRSSVLGVLGGNDRVVSSAQGIWLRNEDGKKTTAIARNTKIKGCQRVPDAELPASIASSKSLNAIAWGKGEINGKTILFPWELTMSAFTKEIVENTARRTAQEIIKMAGDKGWSRPVYIQVVTEPTAKGLKVTHAGSENEIYVTTDPNAPAPAPDAGN